MASETNALGHSILGLPTCVFLCVSACKLQRSLFFQCIQGRVCGFICIYSMGRALSDDVSTDCTWVCMWTVGLLKSPFLWHLYALSLLAKDTTSRDCSNPFFKPLATVNNMQVKHCNPSPALLSCQTEHTHVDMYAGIACGMSITAGKVEIVNSIRVN